MNDENLRIKFTPKSRADLELIAASEWPPYGKGELLNALSSAMVLLREAEDRADRWEHAARSLRYAGNQLKGRHEGFACCARSLCPGGIADEEWRRATRLMDDSITADERGT